MRYLPALILSHLLIAAIAAALTLRIRRSRVITRVDTVTVRQPVPAADSVIVRYATIFLPMPGDTIIDTSSPSDTIIDTLRRFKLTLPVTQRIYTSPDYTAWVSGYQPALDSIRIRRSLSVLSHVTSSPKSSPRLSFGLSAGYGITPAGPQPYIGIGLNYTIFRR